MHTPQSTEKSKGKQVLEWLQLLVAWLLVAGALIFTLLQLKALILYLALLLIENETLRPTGWNTGTIVAVDKCSTLLGVIAWLVVSMFAGNQLQASQAEGRFWTYTGRLLGAIIGLYLLAAGVLFVISAR